jgi:hypothetical protein
MISLVAPAYAGIVRIIHPWATDAYRKQGFTNAGQALRTNDGRVLSDH